ncbi:MAG: NAD(P)-binding domain-containing protein [Sandaracinaceae bacterium]|nr:NAD(P)-binding domain-containing protein [Sandaracinaceae bacterium]
MSAPVGVVGGGRFGRSLATAILRSGDAILWSRSGGEEAHVTTEVKELSRCELIFLSVPSTHVPAVAKALAPHLDGRHLLVHVSRGLIGDDLWTVSRHLRHNTPARRVGCLAGPLDAEAFSEDRPGGGIVGTQFPEVADAVRAAIAGASLRLYDSRDVVGVEVASAMVGLLALQAGFCLERHIPPSAMAVMMSRGLAEAARVGVKLGGEEATFYGMAGSGDLFAALGGDERAEVRLGRALARKLDLEAAGREAGAYIEGVTIARRVAAYAERVGIEAPIAAVTARALDGEMSIEDGLRYLMER